MIDVFDAVAGNDVNAVTGVGHEVFRNSSPRLRSILKVISVPYYRRFVLR